MRRFHSTVPPGQFLSTSSFSSSPHQLALSNEASSAGREGWFDAFNRVVKEVWSVLRRFSVFLLIFSILKYLGSVPVRAQRVLIHTVQPIIVAGFYLVFMFLAAQPEYSLLPVGMVAIGMGWRYWQSRFSSVEKAGSEEISAHVISSGNSAAGNSVAVHETVKRQDESSSRCSSAQSTVSANGSATDVEQRAETSEQPNMEETRPVMVVEALHLPIETNGRPVDSSDESDENEKNRETVTVVRETKWESSSESDGHSWAEVSVANDGWWAEDSNDTSLDGEDVGIFKEENEKLNTALGELPESDIQVVSKGCDEKSRSYGRDSDTSDQHNCKAEKQDEEDDEDECNGQDGKWKGVMELVWESSSESDGYPVWPGEV